MFNPTQLPAAYKTGSQSPLDAKGYFADGADMLDVSNDRPLSWYIYMECTNMTDGKTYIWTESLTGLLPTSYKYPANVVSFGIDYSEKDFNFIEQGLFETSLDDSLVTPDKIGGIESGTTVASLKLLTDSQILANILFETVLAYILSNNSISLSGVTSQDLEVGTSVTPNVTVNYLKGSINNGDGTLAGDLTGDLNNLIINNPAAALAYAQATPVNNTDSTALPSFVIAHGANKWSVVGDYDAGTTTYKNNKNINGTNLAANQASGQSLADSGTKTGKYYRWHYLGTEGGSPTNSAGVRSLSDKEFLSLSNTGSFNVTIPSGAASAEFSLIIPAGKTILINDVGNLNLDITSEFTETNLNVNDANGDAVSYTIYTRVSGPTGYLNPTSFSILIS